MEKQQRTHFVGVKFTHDERQQLERLSKYSGQPLSKVIRDLIQKGLEA
jgi:hypothetical protein